MNRLRSPIVDEKALEQLIRDVVQDVLSDHQSKSKWMTRMEAAEYLAMSAVTFDKYSMLYKAPYYRPDGSSLKLYKCQELDEWMMKFRREGD